MPSPKPTKDFSAPPGGRRLRISLDVYNPANRQYRHIRGVGARITVGDKAEETRLWRAILDAIASSSWRYSPDGSADADVDAAGARADSAPAAVE